MVHVEGCSVRSAWMCTVEISLVLTVGPNSHSTLLITEVRHGIEVAIVGKDNFITFALREPPSSLLPVALVATNRA